MRKSIPRVILLCGILAALLSVSALAADHDVYTAADLVQMAGRNETYYLRNDLDLTNWGDWTPINFYGTFDGQGHTIQGIVISGPNENGGTTGFFDDLRGTVRNLHLEVDVTGGESDTGGLAGYLDGGTVSQVSVSGNVRGSGNVGGLIGISKRDDGFSRNPSIFNCFCEADVSVTSPSYGYHGCGGLVGAAERTSIWNCYAMGTVTPLSPDIEQTVFNVYYYNGLLGYSVGGGAVVSNSYYCNYNDASITGAGVYMLEEDMKQQYNYVDWDFSTVWAISPNINDGFPYLRGPAAVSPTDVTLNWTELTLQPDNAQ